MNVLSPMNSWRGGTTSRRSVELRDDGASFKVADLLEFETGAFANLHVRHHRPLGRLRVVLLLLMLQRSTADTRSRCGKVRDRRLIRLH